MIILTTQSLLLLFQHSYANLKFVADIGSCDMGSVIRLGEFWKFLLTIFLAKVAQKAANFLGYFVKPLSYVNTVVATFLVIFGNIWSTFYSNIWSHWMWELTWLSSIDPDFHSDHEASRLIVEDDVWRWGSSEAGLGKPPLLQLGGVQFRRRFSAGIHHGRVRASPVTKSVTPFFAVRYW